MESYNAGTTVTIPLSFTDEDNAAVTPSAARYRLDDVINATSIVAWTAFTPSSSTYDLVITAAQNAILSASLEIEVHRLTVEITYGTDSKKALSTLDFEVRKISVAATTRENYITAIKALVGGDLPLGEAEMIYAINKAVKKYSADSPREVIEDESGTGAFDYALATALASWTDKFSVIKAVEYPVDDTEEIASVLQDDAWCIYAKPAGSCLRFLEDVPAAGESFRVTYTALHTCNGASCTIPVPDEEAVQILAAAVFCDMLAAYYAQTADSTIGADSVDHKSKATEYASRARAYRKEYLDHIGITGTVKAASVTRDQDATPSWRHDGLTHPRKFR